jgi:hypothetical protein
MRAHVATRGRAIPPMGLCSRKLISNFGFYHVRKVEQLTNIAVLVPPFDQRFSRAFY